MILGPSFTSQAKVIAEMASYYNLLDVSIFKHLAKAREVFSIQVCMWTTLPLKKTFFSENGSCTNSVLQYDCNIGCSTLHCILAQLLMLRVNGPWYLLKCDLCRTEFYWKCYVYDIKSMRLLFFDRCSLYNRPVSKKLIFVVSVDTSV